MDAVDVIRNRKISELPVVDTLGPPVGMIHITDLIGVMSAEEMAETSAWRSRSG